MAIAGAAGFQQYDGAGLYGSTGFSQANPIFKDDYLPAIRNLLNSKRILMRYIRRSEEAIYGNKAIIALRTGRNEGHNSIDEFGQLPDPETQVYGRASYRMRYNYGRIKVTGPAMAASDSDRGAWLQVLDGEVNGLVEDLQHEMNRIAFGDGSGRLCRVVVPAGGSFTTTLSCDRPGGFANNLGKGTQYLREGMKVALILPITSPSFTYTFKTAHNGSVMTFWVFNVDYQNSTFQLSATNPRTTTPAAITISGYSDTSSLSAAQELYVVKASEGGIATATAGVSAKNIAWMKEPYGLAAIVGNSNVYPNTAGYHFGEIDASAEPTWRSFQIDNGGVPMSFDQDLLQQMLDGADIQGDGRINLLMTTHGIRRRYANTLLANKRFVNKMQLDGGFEAVEFDMRPMVYDKDCTRGRIYGLDQESIMAFYQSDWFWMDKDGSYLSRMPDTDAYQAVLVKYCNFGTDARNKSALVADFEDF